jgi:hypothetical protein
LLLLLSGSLAPLASGLEWMGRLVEAIVGA